MYLKRYEADQVPKGLTVKVEADSGFPTVAISIVDAGYNVMTKGVGRLVAHLAPGIYKVRYSTGGAILDELFEVKPEQNPLILPKPTLRVSSPAPLASSQTADADEETFVVLGLSKKPAISLGVGSELFVFVRDIQRNPAENSGTLTPPQRLAFGLKLFDFAGNLIQNFATMAPGSRCAGANVALNPGSYILRLERAGHDTLEQTIVTCAGWQTQVCLPLELLSPEETTRRPSLENAAIFMAPIGEGFSANADMSQSVEMARTWLARGEPMVNEEILCKILCEHDNPMFWIYAAHLLMIKRDSNKVLLRDVSENLKILLGNHPDVTAIDVWLDPDATVPPFSSPPMLRSSWSVLVSSRTDHTLIPPASYTQRITGRLWGSGVWLVWSAPPRVSVTVAETSIDLNLLSEYVRKQLPGKSVSQLVRQETTEKNLNSVESAVITYVATLAESQIAARELCVQLEKASWLGPLKALYRRFVPFDAEVSAEKVAENRMLTDNILYNLHIPRAALEEAAATLFAKFGLKLPKRERNPQAWGRSYGVKLLRVEHRQTTVVDSRNPLNYSGIFLEEGSTYNFESAADQKWNDWYIRTDADGYDTQALRWFERFRRIPSQNWLKLIGTLDTTLDDPIIIGKKLSGFKAAKSGELILFANDVPQMYWNNSRAIALTITKVASASFHEEVFWIGADGDVSSTWRDDNVDNGAWHPPFAIAILNSVRTDSPLVAISRNPWQVEVFWIGADGNVGSTWQNDNVDKGAWHPPFAVASPNSARGDSPLVAISRNPSHEEVFWIGADGDVSSTWRDDNVDNGAWHPPFAVASPNSARGDSPLVAISRR